MLTFDSALGSNPVYWNISNIGFSFQAVRKKKFVQLSARGVAFSSGNCNGSANVPYLEWLIKNLLSSFTM